MATSSEDPMDRLDPQYKTTLEPALVRDLRSLDVPPGVTDAMLDFAMKYLDKETVGVHSKLVETLELLPLLPSNGATDRLVKRFPKGIQMKHFAAVYKILIEEASHGDTQSL